MAVRYAGDNLQSWTKKKERNQANMINLSEDVSCPNNCIVHKRIEPKYLLPSMELLVSSWSWNLFTESSSSLSHKTSHSKVFFVSIFKNCLGAERKWINVRNCEGLSFLRLNHLLAPISSALFSDFTFCQKAARFMRKWSWEIFQSHFLPLTTYLPNLT